MRPVQICTLLACLVVGCLLLDSGCGPTQPRLASQARTGNPWTQHGVLRWADTRSPDNLNPLLAYGQLSTELSMFWAGHLFHWNDRNQLVPELATAVPTLANGGIAKDGLSITYHLRQGVRWQDGVPFDADDVIYTWRQVMNPLNNVPSRIGYDDVARITAGTHNTLVVTLRKPFAPFVQTFFTMAASTYCVLPRHLLAGYADLNHVPYNDLPIGTGPFRIVADDKGHEIRMLANPLYWRGAPRLHEVDFLIVPDDNTILTELRSHEVDFQMSAPTSNAIAAASIPGIKVYRTPFTSFHNLTYNTSRPLLADVKVRQALHYATDVNRLANAVERGLVIPATSDQPPFLWAYNPKVMRYRYDPGKASALLDAAGWKLQADGFRYRNGERLALELSAAIGSANVAAIEVLMQQQWRKAGVEVDIKNLPANLIAGESGVYRTGDFDIVLDSFANGVDPDDSQSFLCDQIPPNGADYSRYCSAAMDEAQRRALSDYRQDARKRAYASIQALIAQQQPLFILWFDQRKDIANTDLRGFRPAHAVTAFWNTWEWSI